jgi:hypothetical protein
MKFLRRLLDGSVLKLTRAACIFALLGLALMSYSIIDPRAIPVITAMSVGHAFGISAFGCYLFAVVLDARRSARTAASDTTPAAGHSVSASAFETNRDSTSQRDSKPNQASTD